MQFPAVMNIVMGFVYLAMALSFPLIFNNGYYVVAIAYVVMILIHHGIIHPIYYIYLLGGHPLTFIRSSMIGVVWMVCLMMFGRVVVSAAAQFSGLLDVSVVSFTNIGSVMLLGVLGVLISGVYLLVVLKGILSKEEKDQARMFAGVCAEDEMGVEDMRELCMYLSDSFILLKNETITSQKWFTRFVNFIIGNPRSQHLVFL